MMGMADLNAQSVVRGRVTDAKTNRPIAGATVAELSSDNRIVTATNTDIDGNYAITVKSTANRLNISYIVYFANQLNRF